LKILNLFFYIKKDNHVDILKYKGLNWDKKKIKTKALLEIKLRDILYNFAYFVVLCFVFEIVKVSTLIIKLIVFA